MNNQQATESEIRTVPCPTCGAGSGFQGDTDPCRSNASGRAVPSHAARRHAFVKSLCAKPAEPAVEVAEPAVEVVTTVEGHVVEVGGITPASAPVGTRVFNATARRFATVTGWLDERTIGTRYDNGGTYCGPTFGAYCRVVSEAPAQEVEERELEALERLDEVLLDAPNTLERAPVDLGAEYGPEDEDTAERLAEARAAVRSASLGRLARSLAKPSGIPSVCAACGIDMGTVDYLGDDAAFAKPGCPDTTTGWHIPERADEEPAPSPGNVADWNALLGGESGGLHSLLTFEEPPVEDVDHVLTREDIARELNARPGQWAIVARPDRMARAETIIERIWSGREYGPGYAALVRKVGGEIRVYAQQVAR